MVKQYRFSELGERRWADYREFATRDVGGYDIVHLFVDGIAERIRPGSKREPVVAARGFTAAGGRVLLRLMAGSSPGTWYSMPLNGRS